MSWLSDALKRNHLDVLNKIAKPVQAVVNPMLDKMPVVGSVKAGVEALGDLVPGGSQGSPTMPSSGLTAADWLKTIAGGVGAGLNYKNDKAAQEEATNRFARTQGQSELQTAANAQNLINRAPMADNAQALLMARMGSAPTTFAPRDFTKGPISAQSMAAPATGGPQDALAAARTAAGAYQPGQGGVDTSVLELLKKRMLARNA